MTMNGATELGLRSTKRVVQVLKAAVGVGMKSQVSRQDVDEMISKIVEGSLQRNE